MAIANSFCYVQTKFLHKKFLEATKNKYRVVAKRPYHDKKGKIPDGITLTLTILEDDYDYGVDKEGKPRDNNVYQNFDVTVLNDKASVQKGDIISLIDFDEEHSYVINFDLILRFKDLKVITPRNQKPAQAAGRPYA